MRPTLEKQRPRIVDVNVDRVYEESDLNYGKILYRDIDVLNHMRRSQQSVTEVISVHTDYDNLSAEMRQNALEERDLTLKKEGIIRLKQKKEVLKRFGVK